MDGTSQRGFQFTPVNTSRKSRHEPFLPYESFTIGHTSRKTESGSKRKKKKRNREESSSFSSPPPQSQGKTTRTTWYEGRDKTRRTPRDTYRVGSGNSVGVLVIETRRRQISVHCVWCRRWWRGPY